MSLIYASVDQVMDIRAGDVPTHHTASGYGGQIPTRYSVRMTDTAGRPRWYRVYAMAYGNGSTPYVLQGGEMVLVGDAIAELLTA
jgi:hypothetical protein